MVTVPILPWPKIRRIRDKYFVGVRHIIYTSIKLIAQKLWPWQPLKPFVRWVHSKWPGDLWCVSTAHIAAVPDAIIWPARGRPSEVTGHGRRLRLAAAPVTRPAWICCNTWQRSELGRPWVVTSHWQRGGNELVGPRYVSQSPSTAIGSTGRPDSDPPNCGGWSSGTQLICSPAPCWRGEGVFTSVLFIFFSNNSIFSTHDHTFFPLCMWNFSIKQCVAWYVVGVESPMSYTVWKFQPKFWLLSMIKTDLLEKNHFTDFLH